MEDDDFDFCISSSKKLKSKLEEANIDVNELVSDILTWKYRRLVVLAQTNSPQSREFEKVLNGKNQNLLYSLKISIPGYSGYLIVVQPQRKDRRLKLIDYGEVVGLYGSFKKIEENGVKIIYIEVNNEKLQNVIILNPTMNIGITYLVDTFYNCNRRNVLTEKFYKNQKNIPYVAQVGIFKHDIFSKVLLGEISEKDCKQLTFEEIKSFKNFFFSNEVDFCSFLQAKKDIYKIAEEFLKKYIENKFPIIGPRKSKLILRELISLETKVLSFRFSISGKIDILFRGEFFPNENSNRSETLKVILELKTGKRSGSHDSQAMLYQICEEGEFNQERFSLVYYTATKEMIWVQNDWIDFYRIMEKRNVIVSYYDQPELPKVIDETSKCNKYCNQVKACVSWSFIDILREKGSTKVEDIESLGIPYLDEMNNLRTNGVSTSKNLKYLKKMFDNIELERRSYFDKVLFEFDNQILFRIEEPTSFDKLLNRNWSIITFSIMIDARKKGTILDSFQVLVKDLEIRMIHQSDRSMFFTGLIKQPKLKKYSGISDFEFKLEISSHKDVESFFKKCENKKEFEKKYLENWYIGSSKSNNTARMNQFVIDFVTDPRLIRKTEIVVGATEKFHEKKTTKRQPLQLLFDDEKVDFFEKINLNSDQKEAIYSMWHCCDFLNVEGFPGCGKTHVIIYFIAFLIRRKTRVLITSHTHKALNIILSRLYDLISVQERKMVIRLVENKEADESDKFDVYSVSNIASHEDYLKLVNRYVFASTVLSIDKFNFEIGDFEYVIVDECSLLMEPLVLKILSLGKKFILIGDYRQLRPITNNTENNQGEMSLKTSLFEKLCVSYPEHTVVLAIQYRMNRDIMFLVNNFVYQKKLKCTSDDVYLNNLTLQMPKTDQKIEEWVKEALFPKTQKGVCFLDIFCPKMIDETFTQSHDFKKAENLWLAKFPNKDYSSSDFIEHLTEEVFLWTVNKVYEKMTACGLEAREILILTTLNRQKERLKEAFSSETIIMTIDKSQGFEAKVVILILSNNSRKNCSLLENYQRVNVAISRAKAKLIIVADSEELKAYSAIKLMVEIVQQQNWDVILPSEPIYMATISGGDQLQAKN